MQCNVGKTDKTVRIVAGAGLIIAGIVANSVLLGVIGVVALVTGFMRFCPAYKLIGMDTAKSESNA